MTTWTAPAVSSSPSWGVVAPPAYARRPVVYSAALEPVLVDDMVVVIHVSPDLNWVARPVAASPEWKIR